MRRIIALCSVMLVATVMLGACGGDSDDTGSNSPDTTADSGDNGDDGDDNDLADLYAEAAKARFKITYTTGDGDEQTFAQDGEGNSVYGSGDTLFFTSSDGSVSCQNVDTEPECTSVPGGTSVSPFLGIFNAGRTYIQALGQFGDTDSETIAGRDATCVTFSQETIADAGPVAAAVASAIEGSVVYCIDDETGVLMSFTTTDKDGETTDSFTVTSFEEPEDSDFEPPAEPQTITVPSISLPDGVTIPTIPGNG